MDAIAKIIGYILLGSLAISFFNNPEPIVQFIRNLNNKTNCNIVHQNLQPETFIIKEQLDFGYVAYVTVKNLGEQGKITVRATLSTSEGNFERTQSILFNENEIRTLYYQFHEPTINATGIQQFSNCSP